MNAGIRLERALVSTRLIVNGHLLTPLWWSAERRRARRAEVFGSVVSDYLRKHYLAAAQDCICTQAAGTGMADGSNLAGGTGMAVSATNVQAGCTHAESEAEPERIFSIWFQGEENAPQLVRNCYASVRRHIKDHELVVLDRESLHEWISLPQEILDKFAQGKIGYAHFADICRVELLHRHGGYWIDATAFVTSPIPQFIQDSEFFVYCAGHRIRGYYSFIQNCFIHARKGSCLLEAWRAMILAYWMREDSRVDYFQHQLMFKVLVQGDKKAAELFSRMPKYEQDNLHSLWYIHGQEQADPLRLEELTGADWFFQKTSFKEVGKVLPGSWREFIMKQTD